LANILGIINILKIENDLGYMAKKELLDAINVCAQQLDIVIKDVVFKANSVNKV
jgi:hypothetical protein